MTRKPNRTNVDLDGVSIGAREFAVLGLVVEGLTNAGIGARLRITGGTVKGMVRALTQKLDTNGRVELAVKAVRRGWVA